MRNTSRYPSQELPRITITGSDDDYRYLDRIERFLKKEAKSPRRIPYAVLFKTALRVAPLDDTLMSAYLEVLSQDKRYKKSRASKAKV